MGRNKPVLIDYVETADTLELVSSKATAHLSEQTSGSKVFQVWLPLPRLTYPPLR